jgi:hypothetical protein
MKKSDTYVRREKLFEGRQPERAELVLAEEPDDVIEKEDAIDRGDCVS